MAGASTNGIADAPMRIEPIRYFILAGFPHRFLKASFIAIGFALRRGSARYLGYLGLVFKQPKILSIG
jgi:hypothetical protein